MGGRTGGIPSRVRSVRLGWPRIGISIRFCFASVLLLGLLSCLQQVDFLAQFQETRVVLLLQLGSNLIQRHQRRRLVYVIVVLSQVVSVGSTRPAPWGRLDGGKGTRASSRIN